MHWDLLSGSASVHVHVCVLCVCVSVHVLMRDEKEGRKKQARLNKQAHPMQSLVRVCIYMRTSMCLSFPPLPSLPLSPIVVPKVLVLFSGEKGKFESIAVSSKATAEDVINNKDVSVQLDLAGINNR